MTRRPQPKRAKGGLSGSSATFTGSVSGGDTDGQARLEQTLSEFPSVAQTFPKASESSLEGQPVRAEESFEEPGSDHLDRPPPHRPSPAPERSRDQIDPIEAAAGRSVSLKSIRAFRWPGGSAYRTGNVPYLSGNILTVLLETVSRFAPDENVIFQMTTDHLVATLLVEQSPSLDNMFIGQFRWMLEPGDPRRPSAGKNRDQSFASERVDRDLVVLRWDMVDILAEASRVRSSVNVATDEIGTRHLVIGLLQAKTGQAALAAAGLLDQGIGGIAEKFADLLRSSDFSSFGDDREKWQQIAASLSKLQLLVSLNVEIRVSYDADRPQRLTIDALGVREDAEALSNLILLDAAKPPLAIGLFGAWGSGKSTLIKELQHKIHEDLEDERNKIAAGLNDTDEDTRRIRDAVQIEFNAWAYTDSANLWASLTSEIFDQLAVGGIRQDGAETSADRSYSGLVREVRERSSRNANAMRTSDNDIADLRQRMSIAEDKRRAAAADKRNTMVAAAAQTVQELLKPEPRSGSDQVYVSLAAPEKKKEKEALAIVRSALSAGGNFEERVTSYARSAGDIGRGALLTWDYLNARRKGVAAIACGSATLGIVALIWPSVFSNLLAWGPSSIGAVRRLGYLAGAASIMAFLIGLAPAIRVAAILAREIRKRKADAVEMEAAAIAQVNDLRDKLSKVQSDRADAAVWAEKFGNIGESVNAASPELMLEFLMSDSADIDTLRQQLGMIARARRCFEQLDAVIERMRAGKDRGKSIDRIILYIDDLDRCDAAQVSNVLQAVHLLLAFGCFVVVVAVDARWLKQSLESVHLQIKGTTVGHVPSAEPLVTAADYLEKIFQIPLWVRPLIDEDAPVATRYAGYQSFVEAIVRPKKAEAKAFVEMERKTEETVPSGTTRAFSWSEPTRPTQSDKPRRQGLKLTDKEVQLLKDLGPLAAKSPRAVKRMVNIYRLIRVRYHGEKLDTFLMDGTLGVPSYRELLFILACENGLAPTTRQTMREWFARNQQSATATWHPEFMKDKLPAPEFDLLNGLVPGLGTLTCAGLFTAIEEVRRYSLLP